MKRFLVLIVGWSLAMGSSLSAPPSPARGRGSSMVCCVEPLQPDFLNSDGGATSGLHDDYLRQPLPPRCAPLLTWPPAMLLAYEDLDRHSHTLVRGTLSPSERRAFSRALRDAELVPSMRLETLQTTLVLGGKAEAPAGEF